MIPFGYGTERISSELKRLFPAARIARLDRDSGRGRAWLETLQGMKKREIDILIGHREHAHGACRDGPDIDPHLLGAIDRIFDGD